MASGVPALVSERGGPQEIASFRGGGVVCELANPAHAPVRLAGAVSELLRDPQRRQDLARLALATAQDMSWDTVLQQLLDNDRVEPAPQPIPAAGVRLQTLGLGEPVGAA